VLVFGIIPDIHRVEADDTLFKSLAEDAARSGAGDNIGKYSKDVEEH
jgi:hypothetical protein